MSSKIYDVVIIGAGPAGLAAASTCLQEGLEFIVLDEGNASEKRVMSVPQDITSGVGGAGLFCDGKLSFYPSGHALWELPSEEILCDAYKWIGMLTSDFFSSFPPYPYKRWPASWYKPDVSKFAQKHYDSYVLSQAQRQILLNRLSMHFNLRLSP